MRCLSTLFSRGRLWPLLFSGLALGACTGPAGPSGPAGGAGDRGPAGQDGTDGADGADGQNGADGQDGQDGQDLTLPTFVGSDTCGACHESEYNRMIRSGHAYAMVPTAGLEPAPPPEFAGAYPATPPEGYDWADTSYLIGGWGWKVQFVDADGYLVTGGAAEPYTPAQYNVADGSWADFEPGVAAGTLSTDCAPCHTTGWRLDGSQDGLPGMVGHWSEPGVTCEECHGAGSAHVANPEVVQLTIDRDPEACGRCHSQGPEISIPASDGFGQNGQQWNEVANSKHRALDCIDCHDPHASAVREDATWNPDHGIISACESCHFNEAANRDSFVMAGFACTECHMPPATRSALTDGVAGDVATHLFGINTDPAAPQFYEQDGQQYMEPYLTIDSACGHCHNNAAELGQPKTDAELQAKAQGFHDPTN